MARVEQAQNFTECVAIALHRNRRSGKTPGSIAALARALGYARETVSRAINHGEFPQVRQRIAVQLSIPLGSVPQKSSVK